MEFTLCPLNCWTSTVLLLFNIKKAFWNLNKALDQLYLNFKSGIKWFAFFKCISKHILKYYPRTYSTKNFPYHRFASRSWTELFQSCFQILCSFISKCWKDGNYCFVRSGWHHMGSAIWVCHGKMSSSRMGKKFEEKSPNQSATQTAVHKIYTLHTSPDWNRFAQKTKERKSCSNLQKFDSICIFYLWTIQNYPL